MSLVSIDELDCQLQVVTVDGKSGEDDDSVKSHKLTDVHLMKNGEVNWKNIQHLQHEQRQ